MNILLPLVLPVPIDLYNLLIVVLVMLPYLSRLTAGVGTSLESDGIFFAVLCLTNNASYFCLLYPPRMLPLKYLFWLYGLSLGVITDVSVDFLATVALKPFCVDGLGLSRYRLDDPAKRFNADFCLLPAINLEPCTEAFIA